MKLLGSLLAASCLIAEPDAFVVQVLTGGRFGEQLQGYLQAKWLSIQENVPLYYTPFSYSSRLVLDKREMQAGKRFHPSFHQKIAVSRPLPDKSIYYCYYFQKKKGEPISYIDLDWNNESFRKIALEMIAPVEKLPLIIPPKETINIAIHVREGGGFDKIENLEAKEALALKVPPLQFYIDSLNQVIDLFPNAPLYLHLFTDAREPLLIKEAIESGLPQNKLYEIHHRSENRHDANVLEDFFSLFHFDILIRPQSQFSLIPSYLHDFAVVCSPSTYYVDINHIVIDKISIEINQPLLEALREKAIPKQLEESVFGCDGFAS